MAERKISIPIQRFEASRPLAHNVYLHLVLNRRFLKIAGSGESLPAELLQRILRKGYSHLEIASEKQTVDPATFPLYLGEGEDGGSANQGAADSASRSDDSPIVDSQETGARQNLSKSDPGEAHGNEFVTAAEQSGITDTASANLDLGTILGKDGATEEEGAILKKDAVAEDGIESIGKFADLTLSAQNLGGQEVASDDPRIESDPAEKLSVAKINRGQDEEEETALVSNGISVPDLNEERQGPENDPPPAVFKIGTDSEPAENAVVRLERTLEEAKETILNGGEFDFAKERFGILKDAKSLILASKISDRIIELKQLPAGNQAAEELTELTACLFQAEAGQDLSEQTAERFPMHKEMAVVETIISSDRPEADRIVDLSEHLVAYESSREEAKSLIGGEESETDEFGALKRSATSRDVPITASRLAAYLGLSLGYTNSDFLSDLATATICHFSRKDGRDVEAAVLPPLAKLLLENSTEEDSDTTADARQILGFLDLYLDDSECDRSEKEFVQRIFARVSAQATKQELASAWNLNCWNSYVEKGGPTLESHSLCNRAAAAAIKFLRTNLKEA